MSAYHIPLCSVCHLVSEANEDDPVQAQVSVPRMPHAVHERETWEPIMHSNVPRARLLGNGFAQFLGNFRSCDVEVVCGPGRGLGCRVRVKW